ncbi:MAG: DUF1559 domain-containing protein [Planctomycetota bacterium]
MHIPFTCPHCGHQTMVSAEYAGRSGPCVQCGRTITVPYSASASTAPTRSSTGMWVIVILAVFLVVALMVMGMMAALLLPAVSAARGAARNAACKNNLKQIALAMEMYADANGRYPPAYTVDKNGNRLHSWRVLLLPYLEHKALYEQIDLEQPWDSPRNQPFHSQMPRIFLCPSSELDDDMTSYVVIAGPRTLFEEGTKVTPANYRDGGSNTILLAEVNDSGINWMEPRDLDLDSMDMTINGQPGNSIGSPHPQGANAAAADGRIHMLRNDLDPETLWALITREGGEIVQFPSGQ